MVLSLLSVNILRQLREGEELEPLPCERVCLLISVAIFFSYIDDASEVTGGILKTVPKPV